MDIEQFSTENAPTESDATFQLENSYTLDVTVEDTITAKVGSMVAYTGDLSFTGQMSAEGGLTGLIKEATTGEGTRRIAVRNALPSTGSAMKNHGKLEQRARRLRLRRPK